MSSFRKASGSELPMSNRADAIWFAARQNSFSPARRAFLWGQFVIWPCILMIISDLIIRLAPWAGKMNESRAVIGYPCGQDGAILPARYTGFVPQENFIMFWCFILYNKYFIDQACSVKMAGYWPRSFFACLWTSTSSRSINTQEKNLANIQPFWPHAWSITHTSRDHGSFTLHEFIWTQLAYKALLYSHILTFSFNWFENCVQNISNRDSNYRKDSNGLRRGPIVSIFILPLQNWREYAVFGLIIHVNYHIQKWFPCRKRTSVVT